MITLWMAALATTSAIIMTLLLRRTARFSVLCLGDDTPLPSTPGAVPGGILNGVTTVKVYRVPGSSCQIVVSAGSVVNFSGDAIVNAANRGCLSGGGVDGAITKMGGPAMAAERLALPIIPGTRLDRCATGDAKMTTGGSLLAKKCIHAVGPNYHLTRSQEEGDRLLTSAYRRAMVVAARGSRSPGNKIDDEKSDGSIRTLAFPLISAGVFRGSMPLAHVLELGLHSIVSELLREQEDEDENSSSPHQKIAYTKGTLKMVHLMAYTELEIATLIRVADRVLLG